MGQRSWPVNHTFWQMQQVTQRVPEDVIASISVDGFRRGEIPSLVAALVTVPVYWFFSDQPISNR